jgi:hypothetical protein
LEILKAVVTTGFSGELAPLTTDTPVQPVVPSAPELFKIAFNSPAPPEAEAEAILFQSEGVVGVAIELANSTDLPGLNLITSAKLELCTTKLNVAVAGLEIVNDSPAPIELVGNTTVLSAPEGVNT